MVGALGFEPRTSGLKAWTGNSSLQLNQSLAVFVQSVGDTKQKKIAVNLRCRDTNVPQRYMAPYEIAVVKFLFDCYSTSCSNSRVSWFSSQFLRDSNTKA